MYSCIPYKLSTAVHHLSIPPWPCHFKPRFLHIYLIGNDWFSTNQLHLHQELQSIVDPAPFPLHVNQISTLPTTHILVKTISKVTIPPRTLAIVPTTFNNIPTLNCYYNFTEMSYKPQKPLCCTGP